MIIDFHTYPVMIKELFAADPGLERSVGAVFGFHFPPQPLEGFLLEMDEAGVDRAVLLPTDCATAHGCQVVTNEQVARLADAHPRFTGFASVDPNLPGAPKQLEHAIQSLGLKGLNLDPSLQCFSPNDPRTAYPIYETCARLGIPVLVQCGMNWAPGALAKYAQPLLLEEPIQTFPELTFILGRFGWPWVAEALMLAVKYPNACLDTAILYSGTPQDTLRRVLSEQIGLDVITRSLYNKLLFGSAYPRVDIRRTLRGFKALNLPLDVERLVLGENASRLLSLTNS